MRPAKLEMIEERINEHGDGSIEIIQHEKQRKDRKKWAVLESSGTKKKKKKKI